MAVVGGDPVEGGKRVLALLCEGRHHGGVGDRREGCHLLRFIASLL